MIVLPHLFSSGVHNQRGITKRTMAQRPWNDCMMKGMVCTETSCPFVESSICFLFLIKIACTPTLKLPTMKDSYGCIVVLYFDYGDNRYTLCSINT